MSWEEIITNIICSAINGIIVGIFTVIGVGITIKNEKKKERRQEKKEKYNNKPELTVSRYISQNEEDFEMKLLVARFNVDEDSNFKYSDKYKNKNEYIFKDFIFKNVGKTPIETLHIVSNYKDTVSIFNIKYADSFMKNGIINCGQIWDKKMFPGQELKIRLYFHRDMIVTSAISCAFIMQFNDSNGACWEQSFFENECNIYSPVEISYKEYKDSISTKKVMECFEKPYLW